VRVEAHDANHGDEERIMRTRMTNVIALAAGISTAAYPLESPFAFFDPPCDARSDAFYVGFALRVAELEFRYGAGEEQAMDFGAQLTRAAAKMMNPMPERDALTRLSERAKAMQGTRESLAQEVAQLRAAIYGAMDQEQRAWMDFGLEVGGIAQACWLMDEESWDSKRAQAYAIDRLKALAALRGTLAGYRAGADALGKLDAILAYQNRALDTAAMDNLFDGVNALYKAALQDAP
jgi:hypothetical protein